ncbi:MAG: hypothetical protein RR983_21155 [Massilia sp.]|uniref:hypothetical protein n=1 Tax=Massilia sp. TaxID=1882437 RepID=UPI002FCB4094
MTPMIRSLWVDTGLSRPLPGFQPSKPLCWLDRPDSAKSRRECAFDVVQNLNVRFGRLDLDLLSKLT